jgi:hypothetical protein
MIPLRFFLFLPWAMLCAGIANAQQGPGHTACEFKWVEAGKPADYTGFMEKCLAYVRTMQTYRSIYDWNRIIAARALVRGNIDDATAAASRAQNNVPNGMNVTFARSRNGITATVEDRSGKSDPQQINLTVPQFNEWLHQRVGQYDPVFENGAAENLKKLSQGPGLHIVPESKIDWSKVKQPVAQFQPMPQPQRQAPQTPSLPTSGPQFPGGSACQRYPNLC